MNDAFEKHFVKSYSISPLLGCLPMFLVLFLLCLLPVMLYDTGKAVLEKLGMSPESAGLAVLGIFVGSLINIPVHELRRDELQPEVAFGPWGQAFSKRYRRVQSRTVIAVNVGGCVIPVILAIQQALRVTKFGNHAILSAIIVALLSIGVSFRASRTVPGIGIMMPGWVAPVTCVIASWILMPNAAPSERAAVAFIAGVAGPLIGADLLNLKKINTVPVGIMSIGGAGTFDGIVLSAMLAALLT